MTWETLPWEMNLLHWFESIHNPVLNVIMYCITMLGELGLFWILLALVMMFILPKKYRTAGITMLFALLISVILCNGVMKHMFTRPRPFWIPGTKDIGTEFEELFNYFHIKTVAKDWSFPSGHTAASFAAAVAMFIYRKKEGIVAIVVAALVAVSRLYLTVHFPTDVLMSVVVGSLFGIIAYFITKLLIAKWDGFKKVFVDGESYKILFAKKADK